MTASPLRLGLVTSTPYHHHGGVPSHTLTLGRQLETLGVHVTFISPTPEKYSPPTSHLRVGRALKTPTPNGSWATLTLTAKPAATLTSLIKERGLDLLHFQELTYPVMSWQLLTASRVPALATFHTGWNQEDNNLAFDQSYVWLSRHVLQDKLIGSITVSEVAARCNAPLLTPNNVVIPPLTDFSLLTHPLPRPVAIRTDKLNLLFIGRFDTRKGLPLLLKALKALPATTLNRIHVHVIGSGPQKLRANLAQNGLSGILTFHGKLTQQEKFAFLQHSDIFLAPSTHGESFGMILIEAMAAGLPIIAGDNDGYLETLQGYPAPELILDPRDTPRFTTALTSLTNSPRLRRALSSWGKKEVVKYAPAKLAARHLDYYRQLLLQ